MKYVLLIGIYWNRYVYCYLIWIFMGVKPVPISVNLSRRHAEEMDAAEHLCSIVDSYALNHDLFEVEITETYDENKNRLKHMIRSIRNKGFRIAVDDFGKGYSSFSFIRDIDFDTLKLDKSFLSKDCSEQSVRAMLSGVVRMGRELKVRTVAEGVENVDQLSYLSLISCDVLQGDLLSEPLPRDKFIDLLRRRDSLK